MRTKKGSRFKTSSRKSYSLKENSNAYELRKKIIGESCVLVYLSIFPGDVVRAIQILCFSLQRFP